MEGGRGKGGEGERKGGRGMEEGEGRVREGRKGREGPPCVSLNFP